MDGGIGITGRRLPAGAGMIASDICCSRCCCVSSRFWFAIIVGRIDRNSVASETREEMPRILMTGAAGRNRHELAQAAAADLSGPAAERSEGAGRSRQERKIQGGRSRRPRRRSRRSARASTASCISAAIRSKARGTRSCSPTSSAATICSRPRARRASSAWCSPPRTMRSASIRAITGSAPTSPRGPTAATASARCLAKRSARSMPTSTGLRSPASGSAISATSRWITAGCRSGSSRKIWCSSAASGSNIPTSISRCSTAPPTTSARWWDNSPRLRPRLSPDRPRRGFSRARHGRAGQAQAGSGRRFLPGRRVLQHGVRRRRGQDRGAEVDEPVIPGRAKRIRTLP